MKRVDIPLCPPLDGSIAVLPGFLDFHIVHNSSVPYFVYPSEDPASPDYIGISFSELFADATHRVAHHIRPVRASPEYAVVGMLLRCDILLYHAITTGAVRAGLVPFPMYTNLTAIAIASMLQRVDCHR